MDAQITQISQVGRVGLQVQARRPEPRTYAVLAITAGDGNGLRYSDSVLMGALALFEGVTVHVDHAQLGEMWSQTGGRSLRSVLGVLEGVYWSEVDHGIAGTCRVYPGQDAEWFCALVDEFLSDRALGRAVPDVGLSAVLDVVVKDGEVVEIVKVVSVDAVYDPARGGVFVRAVNARQTQGGQEVEEKGKYEVTPAGEPRGVGLGQGSPAKRDEGRGAEEKRVDVVPVAAVMAEDGGGASAAAGESRRLVAAMSEALLETRLDRCHLPGPLQEMLRTEWAGRIVVPSILDQRIESLQAAWAKSLAEQGPGMRGVGPHPNPLLRGEGVEVGLSEVERLQAALDRLCGLKPASEALAAVPRLSGIRELYLLLTGDQDFRGAFAADRVALANVTTATMTSLVKNAFNKVILDYFNTVARWWESIIAEESFASTKDLTLVTVGGFTDLPTVAEGAAYTETEWSDTEEIVSFVKKGSYIGVTLEMMDRDETSKFRAIPRKLAIAGYRSLSGAIASLFTANSGVGAYWPASQSVHRLFNGTYGNLGSSALSAATWDAYIQAMYKMTEATSSERMGIRPSYLVVPIELEKTALTIMDSAGEPGTGDNDINVRRASSRVVVCPEMTDANDWLAVADPRVWPAITVGFRFGNVPEVFVAGEETVGSMFTNDEMRIKARYFFAAGVGDYRPLYKANVT